MPAAPSAPLVPLSLLPSLWPNVRVHHVAHEDLVLRVAGKSKRGPVQMAGGEVAAAAAKAAVPRERRRERGGWAGEGKGRAGTECGKGVGRTQLLLALVI